MKLTIRTLLLQEMVSKAIKGASNNKMIPLTGLMAMEFLDGVLIITTTDGTNTLKVKSDAQIEGEPFYAVVHAEIFSRLVSRLTTDAVIMEPGSNGLSVKANGSYLLELPLNDDGTPIRFPKQKFNEETEVFKVSMASIKTVLSANRASRAQTLDVPCLTGYYFNDTVITTDSYRVCSNDLKLFQSPVLLPAELVDLLDIITEDSVSIQVSDHRVRFTTKQITILGSELEGIEEFPVEPVKQYIQTEFEHRCKLPTNSLLNLLGRLSLFIDAYDRNGVYLTFIEEGVLIKSRKSNGTELIKYLETDNFAPFTCAIDIELFQSQIAGLASETVELWYGIDKAIKMTAGKITAIGALLEDDGLAADGQPQS